VGVVVLPRHPRGVKIVAERGAHAGHLVGGDLLPLTAAANYDSAVGTAAHHRPRHVRADLRVVHRLGVMRAAVVDLVSESRQRRYEVLFERKSGVVGADRDLHDCGIIAWWPRSPSPD